MIFKPSYYNFLIPVYEKGIFLLYNSLTGGLFELQEVENEFLTGLFKKTTFTLHSIPKFYKLIVKELIDGHFIVKEDLDEKTKYLEKYYLTRSSLVDENGSFAITITPSLECNFACRYCFQDPSVKRKMDHTTINNILSFITKELSEKKIIKNYKTLGITWFGGEPLLAIDVIKAFTIELKNAVEKHNIKYSSSIVTNGSLLNKENINVLKECDISNIQITLDGSASTHNIRRPYKNGTGKSYEKILKNITLIPPEIGVTIRINCDRIVWANISTFFDDLENYGIWPQRFSQINLDLAFITQHNNARFSDSEWYFDFPHFIKVKEDFTFLKLKRYNEWAKLNNKRPAKKSFRMPQVTYSDCMSAVYPGGFVFDTEGYVHKCWEEVDKPSKRVMHVTEEFDKDNPKLSKWLEFNRIYRKECEICKFLPICDSLCTKKVIDDHKNFHCTSWKYNLEDILRKQYLMSIDDPDSIAAITN